MRALVLSLAVSACGADVRVTDSGGGATGSDDFIVWPGQTGSTILCTDDGVTLVIEIWPMEGAAACVGSAGIDGSEVLFILVDDWDGGSGVFPMEQTSLHGTAHATLGGKTASGSITLEPFVDTPGIISWDLDFAEGSTDLSLCFQPPAEACPDPL